MVESDETCASHPLAAIFAPEPGPGERCRETSGGPATGEEDGLVERARRGDARAYEDLVTTYQGIAFRTAYLVAGSADDAQDAAQDAFVKAYRALGRFRRGAPSGRGCFGSSRTRPRTAAVRPGAAPPRASPSDETSRGAAPSPEATSSARAAPVAPRRDRAPARGGAARHRVPVLPRPVGGGHGHDARLARGRSVKSRLSRALVRLRAELEEVDARA